MQFQVALAQIDPVLGDMEKNIEKHLAALERARAAGANLVVFPELSLTGYSIKDMNWDLAVNLAEDTSRLQRLTEQSASISFIAGGVEEGPDFGLYNAAFLFEGGKVRSVHRKTYPPTYGMFEEMRYFRRGTLVRAFETKACGRLGVLICEDLWHLPLPYLLAQDGAHAIVALVNSPTRIGGSAEKLHGAVINSENHKAFARLLSVYLVFCNRVGFEDGVNFWGGSEVVGPDGEICAQAKLFDEDLISARIDDGEIRRARRFSRHFLDDDPVLVERELRRINARRE
jgi:predicted amidohydrolase